MSYTAKSIDHRAHFALPRSLDIAAMLQALCALVWLPQAALIAYSVAQLQAGGGVDAVLLPAVGLAGFGVLRAALEAWASARLHDGARACLTQWRHHTTQVLAARSPLDRDRIASGAAASILAEQAEAILPWLTRYRSAFWRARLVPLILLVPVAWYSWVAAIVLIVAAPLIPIFMAIVGWQAKAASEAQWLKLGDMNAFLLDRLRGLPTLRAFGAVESTATRLRAAADDLRLRTMRVLRIAFLSSAVLELFSALGVALVAVYIGFHLLGHIDFGAWGSRLSLAEGLFVLLLAPTFFEPLRELAAVWHDKASGQAAVDALQRLDEGGMPLVDGAPTPALAQVGALSSPAAGPGIKVSQLAFSFPSQAPLFKRFSLEISPGEKVALVGGSGAGKTVLLSLLAGLVPADAGDIYVDGIRLDADSVATLRARMGWMGQRAHVFAGSVQNNVALASNGASREQLTLAMQSAHLTNVAQAHPGNTLGEGGTGLSGGEGARLSLARLLASKHADLWLVDEPTAHLDSETADLIRHALLEQAQGRTLIVATHDPQLIAKMDRVITIDAVVSGALS